MSKKQLTFEEELERLEAIVAELESGDAPLDQSLALFEEGVKLVKNCNARIDTAEQKVKILTEGENGIEERNFKAEEA